MNRIELKGASRNTLYIALWTVVVALFMTLRLIHQGYVLTSPPGNILIIDSQFYFQWAERIAAGHGLGPTVFFMSPFYPLFMSLILKLSESGVAVTMLVQVLLSLGTLGLIGRFTVRRFGHPAGLIAGFLYALYAPSIYYDSIILSASCILFLVMVMMTCLDQAERAGSRFPIFLAGLAIGIAALARPNILILLPIFSYIFVKRWKNYGIEQAGLLIIATLIVIFPAGLRNYLNGGEWYITTNSAGVNFYIGNHENANGLYTEAPWLTSAEPAFEAGEYRTEAQRHLRKALTLSQASRYWMGAGMAWIVSHPVEWLILEGKKTAYFFNRVETPNNVSFYGVKAYSGVLRKIGFMNFGLLAPIGLVGLGLARREEGWYSSIAVVAGYLIAGLFFFVASEYRYPVTGIMIAYGAGAITRIVGRLRHKEIERAQISMIALLVLLMFCNIPWKTMKTIASPRMDYFNWASVSFAQSDLVNASLLFTAALAWDPKWSEAHIQLAQVFDEMKLRELADKEYSAAGITRDQLTMAREREQLADLIPDSLDIEGNELSNISPQRLAVLGSHFLRLQKYLQASIVLDESVRRDTSNYNALFDLAYALEAVGNKKRALQLYFKLEEIHPADPLIPFRIAWTQYGLNKTGMAQTTLRRVEKKAEKLTDIESINYWKEKVKKTNDTFMNF
ncbi:MAG: glycosyltransferase family 39 protein [Candidatus Electryonea clarkiae]|nr:glycosyltransferase family 39 protein [Candidatus Electryonea clarkiae]MDP8285841.1 glycosyltransferase family 39 protein [Candidatus Electryonea clarkiae]